MQAALLVRSGNVAVAEAFIASRLAGEGGSSVGSLPRGVDTEALMRRADPLQD
jgi:putative acyl-CoA dehydrogenase